MIRLVLVLGLVLVLAGCQSTLSDKDVDRIVGRIAETPVHEDTVDRMVEAFMSHPRYLEYLDDDAWVETFTTALLEHPSYQVTPEEECVATILMASVISGDYTMPSDSEVEGLCAWYVTQSEAASGP